MIHNRSVSHSVELAQGSGIPRIPEPVSQFILLNQQLSHLANDGVINQTFGCSQIISVFNAGQLVTQSVTVTSDFKIEVTWNLQLDHLVSLGSFASSIKTPWKETGTTAPKERMQLWN